MVDGFAITPLAVQLDCGISAENIRVELDHVPSFFVITLKLDLDETREFPQLFEK